MSITQKVWFGFTIALLVNTLLVGSAVVYHAQKNIRATVKSTIADRSQVSAIRIERRLNRIATNLPVWSRNWVMQGIPQFDEDLNIAAFIKNLQETEKLIKHITVFDNDMQLVATTRNSWEEYVEEIITEIPFELHKTAFPLDEAKYILEQRQPTTILSKELLRNAIFHPVYNQLNNTINGGLMVELRRGIILQDLNQINLTAGENERYDTGLRTADQWITRTLHYPATNQAAGDLSAYQLAESDYSETAAKIFYTQQLEIQLPGLVSPLAIQLEQPSHLAFASIEQMIQLISILALMIVAIMTPLSLVSANAIGKPVRNLTHFMENLLASGNYTERAKVKRSDEMGKLSRVFNKLLDDIEENNAKVQLYSRDLEGLVEQRSRTISTIVDNVHAGFLLINDKGAVEEGFTKFCRQLLDCEIYEDDMFFPLLRLSEKDIKVCLFAVKQVFEDIMPDIVSFGLLPKAIQLNDLNLSIEYTTIRNEAGKVQSILVTLSDVTSLVEAENLARHNEMLLSILRLKPAFEGFVADVRAQLSSVDQNVSQSDIRMTLHTLKGNSAAFGMEKLAQAIHLLEERSSIKTSDIQGLLNDFERFLRKNNVLLQLDRDSRGSYLTKDVTENLEALDDPDLTATEMLTRVRYIKRMLHFKLAQTLLGPIVETSRSLAERMRKRVNFTFTGGEILLDPEISTNIMHCVIHAIRNSIDHGIEYPDDREKAGKNPYGELGLFISREGPRVTVVIEDDGAGLDPEKIKARALETGVIAPEQVRYLETEQIQQLIFEPGFTTTQEVSTISGRGIGMSALYTAVHERDGEITVHSVPGQGMRLVIHYNEADLESHDMKKTA